MVYLRIIRSSFVRPLHYSRFSRNVKGKTPQKDAARLFSPGDAEDRQSTQPAPGMYEGAAAPSYEIRRTGFAGSRDRSLPRPVGETGRRSVGNRKERHQRDYASSPEGYSLLPISFGVCPEGAREMMYFAPLTAARMREQTCSDCYTMKPGINSGPYTMNRNTTIRHSR